MARRIGRRPEEVRVTGGPYDGNLVRPNTHTFSCKGFVGFYQGGIWRDSK